MQHNKLFLTKKAKKLMGDRIELFKYLLKAYAEQFNWGFMDGYPDEPVGQVSQPYTLYLLNKYGHDYQQTVFYSDLYKKAFPRLMVWFEDTEYSTGDSYFSNCFITRTFTRFLDKFGLIELDKGMIARDGRVKASSLLNELFEFEQIKDLLKGFKLSIQKALTKRLCYFLFCYSKKRVKNCYQTSFQIMGKSIDLSALNHKQIYNDEHPANS